MKRLKYRIFRLKTFSKLKKGVMRRNKGANIEKTSLSQCSSNDNGLGTKTFCSNIAYLQLMLKMSQTNTHQHLLKVFMTFSAFSAFKTFTLGYSIQQQLKRSCGNPSFSESKLNVCVCVKQNINIEHV